VTNGVDTPVNAAELATRNPALDSTPPHPQIQELPASHNTVLGLSELADAVVNGSKRRFSMPEMGNRRFDKQDADGRLPGRARGALKRVFL
jgi:hypothetical protein